MVRHMSSETHARIVDLSSDEDWRLGGAALQTLRPQLDLASFGSRREQLIADGYRFVGVKVGDEVVSVASYTLSPHAMHGRELLIHDMATKPEAARNGYASLILRYLEQVADSESCWRIFVHTKNAADFYLKNGYEDYSTGLIRLID